LRVFAIRRDHISFAPHFPRTLSDLNDGLPGPISDYRPLTVDLPFIDLRLLPPRNRPTTEPGKARADSGKEFRDGARHATSAASQLRGVAFLSRLCFFRRNFAGSGRGRGRDPSCCSAACGGTRQERVARGASSLVKKAASRLLDGPRPTWAFPAKVAKGQHWIPTLAITGATAGLIGLDPHDTPYFRRADASSGLDSAFSATTAAVAITVVPNLVLSCRPQAARYLCAEDGSLFRGIGRRHVNRQLGSQRREPKNRPDTTGRCLRWRSRGLFH